MARKMEINRCILLFFCTYLVSSVLPAEAEPRTIIRLGNLLGLGPRCHGCPSRFCDDDPAIVHGYCCGCARLFDKLPVKCAPNLRCPINTYELCQQYEYMLQCCCPFD